MLTGLVARLNLPSMAYEPAQKIEVYAQAVRGLLEPVPEQRLKYLDFIDIYAELDENERAIYQQRYPQEAEAMTGFADRFIEQGMQQCEICPRFPLSPTDTEEKPKPS